MTSKLSVLVQADLHGPQRLTIAGALTDIHQRALHPLIRRARALALDIAVIIDLTGAQGVAAPVGDLLKVYHAAVKPAVTVGEDLSVNQAAALMTRFRLNRLSWSAATSSSGCWR